MSIHKKNSPIVAIQKRNSIIDRFILNKAVRRIAIVSISAMLLFILVDRPVQACKTVFPPIGCFESVTMVKAVPGVLVTPLAGTTLMVSVMVTTSTGTTPGMSCPSPATVLAGGTVAVTLSCPAPVGIIGGTAPLPTRTSGTVSLPVLVPVAIPAGAVGFCTITGTTLAPFSSSSASPAGSTLAAFGDTVVCFVEESADIAGEPRLDMQVLSITPTSKCGPGVQQIVSVELTNNDLTNIVTLQLTATSEQRARMPVVDSGVGEGAASISGLENDDLPICFVEDLGANGILPHPSAPQDYDQRPIRQSFAIAPGATRIVQIVNASYLLCKPGSCGELTFIAEGQFANGDPVTACGGQTITVSDPADAECAEAEFNEACCIGDGTCADVVPTDCINTLGGTPLGAFTACAGDSDANGTDDACEGVVMLQACCFEFGTCENLEPLDCANQGGTPQGPGVDCSIASCPILGACCFEDETCQVLLEGACTSAGGIRWGAGSNCGPGGTCVPTVSEWGLVVMCLMMLTAGTIVVRRRRRITL